MALKFTNKSKHGPFQVTLFGTNAKHLIPSGASIVLEGAKESDLLRYRRTYGREGMNVSKVETTKTQGPPSKEPSVPAEEQVGQFGPKSLTPKESDKGSDPKTSQPNKAKDTGSKAKDGKGSKDNK